MDTKTNVIVVFDSNCILCSRWVRFILKNEASETIRFASSRKSTGRALAADFGVSVDQLDLTYLVIRNNQIFTKSDASLVLLSQLSAPLSWFRYLRFVPRMVRDGLYDIVARNRLKWFGEERDCLVPDARYQHRFLD